MINFFRHTPLTKVWFVLIFILLARLVSMYCIPLNDSTEARYAEIARIMMETGNWVTPMHYYGVPFWAKPPLSTWLSAASMKVLGVSAFSARLPAMLLSLGILMLVGFIAQRRYHDRSLSMVAVLILASCIYFILDAGTVMTDPSLLFCTTLIFLSFWQAVVCGQRRWGYVLFIALGLGLLAKGPIAWVLCGMPIVFWVALRKQWHAVWRNLPWFKGMLLTMFIALPWYYLAETRTPGFIQYFIVGEHIQRFLTPGWTGDKYGFAHVQPLGMVWLYALIGVFPWTFVSIYWGIKHRKQWPTLLRDQDGWGMYLLCCTFIPLVFFTFARNIIYPYVFPSLPMFALLWTEFAHRTKFSLSSQQWLYPAAALSGIAFLLASLFFMIKPEWVAKSQDRVVNVWMKHNIGTDKLIYWAPNVSYSALFYASGRAEATLNEAQLCKFFKENQQNYVVIDAANVSTFPKPVMETMTSLERIRVLKKDYVLYRVGHAPC